MWALLLDRQRKWYRLPRVMLPPHQLATTQCEGRPSDYLTRTLIGTAGTECSPSPELPASTEGC